MILSHIGTTSFCKGAPKQEGIEGCPKQGTAHFCTRLCDCKMYVLPQLLLIWKRWWG